MESIEMIGFANGATETLSQIVLDSITTENTFNMEEYYAVEVADSEIRYEKRVKWKLTLSDFMGIGWLEQGEGMPTLENVETVGIFANLFRWDYDIMGEPDQSLDEYLKDFIRSGEFNHKGYHPFKDFLSVLADVTIVVPIMESIMGWDFITGEDLTDFERGMKAIGAVIDLVTFGNGAMLMKAAEAGTLEFVGAIFKTMAVDAAGSGAAYLTGEMLEDLGLPPAAAMILTAIVSGTVTYSAGTYVFKNASGEVLESCSEAELKEILEGIDDIDISAVKGSTLEEVIEGSVDAVDDVIKGGSKTISYPDYDNVYQSSIHNPDAEKVMLGKYGKGGSDSYIAKAGKEYTYFSIDNWTEIKNKYNFTDEDMFSLFNEAFLDDAINEGKTFCFSHDPVNAEGALHQELEYLLQNGYSYDPVSMSASFDPKTIGADGLIH